MYQHGAQRAMIRAQSMLQSLRSVHGLTHDSHGTPYLQPVNAPPVVLLRERGRHTYALARLLAHVIYCLYGKEAWL